MEQRIQTKQSLLMHRERKLGREVLRAQNKVPGGLGLAKSSHQHISAGNRRQAASCRLRLFDPDYVAGLGDSIASLRRSDEALLCPSSEQQTRRDEVR